MQAHLRAFIPEMLKYSTGRSKPGWAKPDSQPIWWPSDVPWANIRCDVRTDEEKKAVSSRYFAAISYVNFNTCRKVKLFYLSHHCIV